MSSAITKNLKTAFFSALLVLAVAYPVLGLKLTTVGIKLELHNASPAVLWTIAACTIVMFFWQLFRGQISEAWSYAPKLPTTPSKATNFITLPSTQRWIILSLIVVALAWPFFGSRGAVDLATLVLIYVMLGLGLNIVVGLAGLLDLGYVGFYAVGAYTYALLSHYYGLGFWVCLPIAGLMAAFFGFILGFPVLRLRGDYLAIVTLGFGEIIRILLNNMTWLTGGPNGMSISPEHKPTLFGIALEKRVPADTPTLYKLLDIPYDSTYKVIFLYLIAVLLVLLTLFLINRLLRMPIGRAWEALREDEIVCRALGMNPTVIKLTAFTIGASLAGFAGSFFAARQGLITPESFTFVESALILAIVVLGGMGSQLGVILAAVVLTLLPELMREFSEYRMLFFGALMVLMMIWRPQGLLPMQRPHLELKQ